MDMRLEQSLLLKDDIDDGNNNNKRKNHYGLSTYALSINRQILAFSRGIGKVTIYLVESGLEIASKDFGEDIKIILLEFFIDDEQLLVMTQAKNEKIAV